MIFYSGLHGMLRRRRFWWEGCHGELLGGRVEHQLEAADVTAVHLARTRPVRIPFPVSDRRLARRTTPRHKDGRRKKLRF